jgi:GntR family transcriptional repressor for pyruvate dehydrogenase complex
LGRIVKKKLSDSVLEEIGRMVDAGELKRGDKLPPQDQLATQLGVSRPSLREALRAMEMIGAIEQRPGYGTVFLGGVPVLYAEHLSIPSIDDKATNIDLGVARRYVETACVELAVERATTEEIHEMGRMVDDMDQALKDDRKDDYEVADINFHYLVAKASQNQFLIHFSVTIRGIMERFIMEIFKILPNRYGRSMEFHRRIYEAIRQRDKKKAVKAMTSHIDDILVGLNTYYGGENQEHSDE